MPSRLTRLRVVNDSNPAMDITAYRPLNLWRVALSAAEETLHGGPLVPAWLQLFEAHLSGSETTMLRWRGDLGASAEMRRVYSALYGRYFARALLASELGLTDFIALDGDITIQNAVTVRRTHRGDIPDWIAWDQQAGAYTLGEAKGRLTGNEHGFLNGTPSCISAGKAQFDRVEVIDSNNRVLAARNWIAANLWSTDERGREPVSLLWDPPNEGGSLLNHEVPRHAAAIRKHRVTIIAKQLGDPAFVTRIAAKASLGESFIIGEEAEDRRLRPIERVSREPHEGDYLAAVIVPLGIRPIRSAADLEMARRTADNAYRTGEPAMIFGLALAQRNAVEFPQTAWLSADGIAASDGTSLFSLKDVDIKDG